MVTEKPIRREPVPILGLMPPIEPSISVEIVANVRRRFLSNETIITGLIFEK